ncbi:hypothetical protein [Mycolicibacterium bacteremicum]|uniref:hypothetical protein n=1 Tax=Mycolicibacterium bacteremicum TaxID=564198 RepID=UPI0026F005EA|nr:hypothetical protein [Mycolicibacterium bacteremicum]
MQRTKRVAMVTAATATATAMTVGAAAPTPIPRPEEHYLRVVEQPVDLTAGVSPFGPPGSLPNVSGGTGKAAYDSLQEFIAAYERAIAGINIGGGFGLNIEDLLSQIPTAFLDDILGAIPIGLGPVLTPVLGGLITPLLIDILDLLNITDAQGNITLSAVLGLLGLDLSDPLNLAGLDIPGVNIITPGEPFTLLKALAGLDLGWTPGTANAVADAINTTPYLKVGVETLLDAVLGLAGDAVDQIPLLGPLVEGVLDLVADINLPDLSLIDVRIPIVIGYGFGAMAAGSAYQQALDDLVNQPRLGANGGGPLGSLTLLPMILANNVGRANGGMLARFYPLFDLLGIDILTPDVAATNEGTGIPVLGTGIELGAANLVPIKVDATVQYQPFSDLAAWPNPVSLFNNLLAGTIGASYILRGVELDSALDQILGEVGETVSDVLDLGNPLNINIYLTLATSTLPLLEPLYLAGDVLDMVSFGTLGTVAYRLANALSPALTSLVNLGYTDVVRNEDGTWTRTLDEAGEATPFMSFPKINWGQAMNDVFTSLVNGFQKEFFSGNPTASPPNVLENLGKLIQTLTNGLNLGGLQQGIDNLLAGLAPRQAPNAQRTLVAAAGELPESEPKLVTLSVDPAGDISTGKHAADPAAPVPGDTGAEPKHAAPEEEAAATDEEVTEEVTEEQVTEDETTEEGVSEEGVTEEEAADEEVADEEAAEEEVAEEQVAEGDSVSPITKRPVVKTRPFGGHKRPITAPQSQGAPEAKADRTDTTKADTAESDTTPSDTAKSGTSGADRDAA